MKLYLESDLAGWLGLPRGMVKESRKRLEMVPAKGNPVAFDEAQVMELLGDLIPEEKDRADVMEFLRTKLEGRVAKKARVGRSQWRNRKLLQAKLVALGDTVAVRVRDNRGWKVGAEISIVPNEDGMTWSLDPEMPSMDLRRAQR